MNDEEREAINHLTEKMKYHKDNPLGTYVWLTLDEHYVRTILNLIKKQQKEIEELKEKNENLLDALNNSILITKYWVSKDKIKKEIEEIRKTHAPEDDYAESQIYILQSLLEKE